MEGSVMKVDYIFGLSEMLHRIHESNLQSNSILVIEYAHQYQCRSYVVAHAIDKGWRSDEISQLIDFMSSGRVIFFAKPHYVGVISKEPREMTGDQMIKFQSDADPFRQECAKELVETAEAAAQHYLDAYHVWLDDRTTDSTIQVRAGQFDILKVDDPSR